MLVSLVKGGLTDAVVSVVSEASGEPGVAQSVCGAFQSLVIPHMAWEEGGPHSVTWRGYL